MDARPDHRATPWVRDFSGLWGLDTDDPFGGERAPAGPRYERNGTIRPSWADPVGWAGLAKVPATATEYYRAVDDRLIALGRQRAALTAELASHDAVLAQLAWPCQLCPRRWPPAVAGASARPDSYANRKPQPPSCAPPNGLSRSNTNI